MKQKLGGFCGKLDNESLESNDELWEITAQQKPGDPGPVIKRMTEQQQPGSPGPVIEEKEQYKPGNPGHFSSADGITYIALSIGAHDLQIDITQRRGSTDRRSRPPIMDRGRRSTNRPRAVINKRTAGGPRYL